MYLRWLSYAFAVLNILIGLAFLIAPDLAAGSSGTTLDATGATLSRFWAAAVVPIGYVAWVAADAPASPLKTQLIRAFALMALLEIVATVFAIAAGVVSAAGAVPNLVAGAVFAFGFGFYGWMRPEVALR